MFEYPVAAPGYIMTSSFVVAELTMMAETSGVIAETATRMFSLYMMRQISLVPHMLITRLAYRVYCLPVGIPGLL
jgi:hypothetical protein